MTQKVRKCRLCSCLGASPERTSPNISFCARCLARFSSTFPAHLLFFKRHTKNSCLSCRLWVDAKVRFPQVPGTLCSNYKLRTPTLLSIAPARFQNQPLEAIKNRRIAFISNPAAFSVKALREECHFNYISPSACQRHASLQDGPR